MAIRINEEKLYKELEKILKIRDNTKSLTEYYYSTEDIYALAYIYANLTGEETNIHIKRNNKLSDYMNKYWGKHKINLYFYFLNQEKHMQLADTVNKTFNESDFISYDRRVVNKLTEKEFLEIERDFLASYDERMLKLFDSHLEKGLIDMRKDTPASAYNTYLSNNHYILLSEGYNIYNLGSLSHELGHLRCHSILDVRSKRQLDDSFMTYYESYSHFMELCLFEYLKKNHIYLSDTLIDENYYYSRMKEYFEMLKTFEQIKPTERNNDVLISISNYYTYSYGILIGTYLHERYLENPNEVKKDIDNYLFYQGLLDKDKELEIIGLSYEELNNPKVLSKRLQKHTENYRKYN